MSIERFLWVEFYPVLNHPQLVWGLSEQSTMEFVRMSSLFICGVVSVSALCNRMRCRLLMTFSTVSAKCCCLVNRSAQSPWKQTAVLYNNDQHQPCLTLRFYGHFFFPFFFLAPDLEPDLLVDLFPDLVLLFPDFPDREPLADLISLSLLTDGTYSTRFPTHFF